MGRRRKKREEKRFSQAADDRKFIMADGRPLANVKELADALEHVSDEIYMHHVNQYRNDFSTWTRDVLNEPELADDLTGAETQQAAQITVLKHIAKKAF